MNIKKIFKKARLKYMLFVWMFLFPFLSFGQSPKPTPKNFEDLVKNTLAPLIDIIIYLIFAIALVIFIWGVVQYVINQEDSAEREKGRSFMIWGIIALFVMGSVYGLVNIITGTFGLDNKQINVPDVTKQLITPATP